MHGKRALVTGAGTRVGRAIAEELHRRHWSVAVHYNRSAEEAGLVSKLLDNAPLVQGDQSQEPHRIVTEAAAALSGLDLLVCSAAQFGKEPSESLPREKFEQMLAVNLVGPFYLMQAALPFLRASRGSIVNLLDLCGTAQVWKGYAHYAASKAGLATLTKLLALEWAPEVRVNGVAPGVAEFPEAMQDKARERLVARIPLGHAGTPQDVAQAVAFLAEAPFITGQILPVDGGRSVNP
jgi:pteridine reductase